MTASTINPRLTLDYMINAAENKYFDRKSSKIQPKDLIEHISGFANAEGGTLIIGISDKTRELEGIDSCGEDKINAFLSMPQECVPMPQYKEEFIDIENSKGCKDRILLLHIFMSIDRIIRTKNCSTFLRIGDKTREVKGEDLRNLEYSKSTRHYEDELNMDAEIADLEEDLLRQYKNILGALDIPVDQILRARGFIKKDNSGRSRLTNAAVLLFAKNITQFYPNCRVRFIRYKGTAVQSGMEINILKDISIEHSLLHIIDETKKFISTQLREFTALNKYTGKFTNVPEYPEFAWQEGIVNAVTHREYGMQGAYIKVSMFDDRLEIQSPGKLPNIVTVENIRETRYSRNPRIARVLAEFGWVRELNEGVKRIYKDMQEFFLDAPVYSEPERTNVCLVLKNNILMRTIRQKNRAEEYIGSSSWNALDDLEKLILTYMSTRKDVTRAELARQTGKSGRTIALRLNNLLSLGLIKRNGHTNDPKQTYSLIFSTE